MRNEILDLQAALTKLGIKDPPTIKWITTDRMAVYINGKYFGIWDTARKTFVD